MKNSLITVFFVFLCVGLAAQAQHSKNKISGALTTGASTIHPFKAGDGEGERPTGPVEKFYFTADREIGSRWSAFAELQQERPFDGLGEAEADFGGGFRLRLKKTEHQKTSTEVSAGVFTVDGQTMKKVSAGVEHEIEVRKILILFANSTTLFHRERESGFFLNKTEVSASVDLPKNFEVSGGLRVYTGSKHAIIHAVFIDGKLEKKLREHVGVFAKVSWPVGHRPAMEAGVSFRY